MAQKSDYILLGEPRKQRVRGQDSKRYYQRFRLAGDPIRKVRSAPCSVDKGLSKRDRNRFIEEFLLRSSGQSITAQTLESLTTNWQQYLESEDRAKDYIKTSISRVKSMIRGCKFSTHRDVTKGKLRTWVTAQISAKQFGRKTGLYYAKAMKTFCRFLACEDLIDNDPLATLSFKTKQMQRTENSRPRRVPSLDELKLLISATRSGKTHSRLTPEQRVLIYIIAANTGLRASEVGSLTRDSFDLDAGKVSIKCTISKRRKRDELSLAPELVATLRPFVEAAAPGPLFPGRWRRRANEMLEVDLAAAGIAPLNEAGEVFDFHALRHCFVTAVAMTGEPMSVVMKICRLSSPQLVERYFHAPEHEAVVAKLPTAGLGG